MQINKRGGGATLPVGTKREEFNRLFTSHGVIIMEAETGAGKSTQVPQWILEMGYTLIHSQPRRLAASSVAERVAWEMGEELGGTVGFRTAYDRCEGPNTRCLFVTDGLALIRELMGHNKADVLILDEVHEWNLNMEVLVAWAKKIVDEGVAFKVIIMSATMESAQLSRFFSGAPVISVPGRMYPVEDRVPGSSIVDDVEKLVREGRNVLVFQPGKREIEETIRDLEAREVNAEILPLHGQLDKSDQKRCFGHYSRSKVVVSTNVAQTSVTIDDIDAVVDSGMERRTELDNGVEGLYLKPISRADAKQRKGRAGRTKPGIYIDHCGASNRLEFPMAEILRTRLDQTVLRLATVDIDAEGLEFFHQPPRDQIRAAKRALRSLGCMDEAERVTSIGKAVNRLPVSVQYARMIVEADRLGVVDDVLDVAAILEQGEITSRFIMRDGQKIDATSIWRRRFCPTEESSDVMAQLAVYKTAVRERMNGGELRDTGVFAKAFFQARDQRRKLADALRGKVREFRSTGKREDILRAVCAGMVDHLFQYNHGSYKNGEAGSRELGQESVLRTGAKWLVGIPWDLQIQTRRGPRTLRLIKMATKVDPEWLIEVAPQLAQAETGLNPRFDAEKDCVVSTTRKSFNGQQIGDEAVRDAEHAQAPIIFAEWLAAQMV